MYLYLNSDISLFDFCCTCELQLILTCFSKVHNAVQRSLLKHLVEVQCYFFVLALWKTVIKVKLKLSNVIDTVEPCKDLLTCTLHILCGQIPIK